MRADHGGSGFEALKRMLKIARPDGGGSDHQRTIRDGLGDSFEFFSRGEDICGADRGAGAIKSHIIGIDDAEVTNSEVAHSASRCAYVEGITGVYQDNAQRIELRVNGQSRFILRYESISGRSA